MAEFTSYVPGTFCWVDTGTSDPDKATAFYSGLFGWEANVMPSPNGPYTMFMKDGMTVAAMYGLMEQQVKMGVPPHWMSYIAVTDAAATLEKVAEAGGSIAMPASEVPGAGVTGLFADPTGAMVGVWQAQEHIGAQLANVPGSLIWNELLTTDPDAAAAFYGAVFGWGHTVQEMPSGPYHLFADGEEMRAGMMKLTRQMGQMPPTWSVYFAVEDIEVAGAKAAELGGGVDGEFIETEGVGRMAVTHDVNGAYFMMMESAI